MLLLLPGAGRRRGGDRLTLAVLHSSDELSLISLGRLLGTPLCRGLGRAASEPSQGLPLSCPGHSQEESRGAQQSPGLCPRCCEDIGSLQLSRGSLPSAGLPPALPSLTPAQSPCPALDDAQPSWWSRCRTWAQVAFVVKILGASSTFLSLSAPL